MVFRAGYKQGLRWSRQQTTATISQPLTRHIPLRSTANAITSTDMPANANDKVVVITGAARGLGLEWVRQYSAEKDTFIVAVVRDAKKASLLEPFVASGRAAIVQADMTQPESFEAAVKQIGQVTGGKVDVLINNAGAWSGAGATPSKDVTAGTPQEWADTFLINTTGPVFFTKAVLPLLEKGTKKQVVSISSFLASPGFHQSTDGNYGFVSYSVAKAALNFANLKYHLQLKDSGYTFVTLNPGYVQTELHGDNIDKAPLTVEQSVTRCKSFVDRLTPADSGSDYSLEGTKDPIAY